MLYLALHEPRAKTGRVFICGETALYPQFIQGYVSRAGKGGNRFKEAKLAGGAAIHEVQDRTRESLSTTVACPDLKDWLQFPHGGVG